MDRNGCNSLLAGGLFGVALRKESVDRNAVRPYDAPMKRLSLSARRAWIEMPNLRTAALTTFVALRKESVDRNLGQLYRNQNER